MRTLFKADWLNATFIHFAIDPTRLQPYVPLPLDLLDGQAIVSLVAFTQKRLRPAIGGRIAECLAAPLSDHEFLNLRTYVRVNGEPAIFFLAEWIPNRLAQLVGPALYGLPYRLARLDYDRLPAGRVSGQVTTGTHRFGYTADINMAVSDEPQRRFLLERYVAYTQRQGWVRRFEIAHEPWKAVAATLRELNLELIQHVAPWFKNARVLSVDFSDGVRDVGISGPRVVRCGQEKHRSTQSRVHSGAASGEPEAQHLL